MEQTILLADDDSGDRFLFQEVLSELDYNYSSYTVKNGVELMEYLENPESSLPVLLFLDINMPLKNGMECLQEIRGNSDFDGMSITVISTSHYDKEITKTLELGANRYFSKPNDYQTLKWILDKAVFSFHLIRHPELTKEAFLLHLPEANED